MKVEDKIVCCLGCKSILLEGKLLHEEEYNTDNSRGLNLSHGIISEECARKIYGGDSETLELLFEEPFLYLSCREKIINPNYQK